MVNFSWNPAKPSTSRTITSWGLTLKRTSAEHQEANMTSVMRLEGRFGNEARKAGNAVSGEWRFGAIKGESPASGGRAPGYRPIAGLESEPAVDSVQTFLLCLCSDASQHWIGLNLCSCAPHTLNAAHKFKVNIVFLFRKRNSPLSAAWGGGPKANNPQSPPENNYRRRRLVRSGRKQKCSAEVLISIVHFHATLFMMSMNR